LLKEFLESPNREDFRKARDEAERLRSLKARETEALQRSVQNARQALRPQRTMPVLTAMLMIMSIVLTVPFLIESERARDRDATYQIQAVLSLYRPFWIEDPYDSPGGLFPGRHLPPTSWLSKVQQGEVWRLLTPIFLHTGVMHLVFNMLALRFLGIMIEARRGVLLYLLLVLVSAVLSNLGQFMMGGPQFGGMSGVIFAMFGYVWICGKLDLTCGLVLSETVVTMVLLWFFLCLFGVIPGVANTAHAVGLAVGAFWGYLDGKRPEWRLKRERRAEGSP
jgi:GlpG protein